MSLDENTETTHATLRIMFEKRQYQNVVETDNFISGTDHTGQRVHAFKEIFTDLNVKVISDIIKVLNNLEQTEKIHGIVIYKDNCTSAVNKSILPTAANVNVNIEIFPQLDLLYVCIHHDLVPAHHRLSSEEALKFKKDFVSVDSKGKYRLKIPIIFTSDPIARFYNFRSGDIIRVERKNELPAFRVVVSKSK